MMDDKETGVGFDIHGGSARATGRQRMSENQAWLGYSAPLATLILQI
jgi:hypothetical protein